MELGSDNKTVVNEQHELLDQMENVLLELESSHTDRDLIKAIFHAAHTVLAAQLYLASIKLK